MLSQLLCNEKANDIPWRELIKIKSMKSGHSAAHSFDW